jgi:hypothetical protein
MDEVSPWAQRGKAKGKRKKAKGKRQREERV